MNEKCKLWRYLKLKMFSNRQYRHMIIKLLPNVDFSIDEINFILLTFRPVFSDLWLYCSDFSLCLVVCKNRKNQLKANGFSIKEVSSFLVQPTNASRIFSFFSFQLLFWTFEKKSEHCVLWADREFLFI